MKGRGFLLQVGICQDLKQQQQGYKLYGVVEKRTNYLGEEHTPLMVRPIKRDVESGPKGVSVTTKVRMFETHVGREKLKNTLMNPVLAWTGKQSMLGDEIAMSQRGTSPSKIGSVGR